MMAIRVHPCVALAISSAAMLYGLATGLHAEAHPEDVPAAPTGSLHASPETREEIRTGGAVTPPHRFTAVAPDDVLNVRDGPGVSGSTIIGRLASDATDIARAANIGADRWSEARSASLPDAGGASAEYLAKMDRGDGAGSRAGSSDHVAAYLASAGHTPVDADAAVARLRENLESPSSAFLPGAELGPLTLAVLVLEAEEGLLPRARYRLRYSIDMHPNPPKAAPVPISYLQVDRFNLGPALHDATRRAADGIPVAPREAFGEGPHVSYRLVTRPVQGIAADVLGLARAEISQEAAAAARCLGLPCLSTVPVAEQVTADWATEEAINMDFTAPYPQSRQGVLTPAAAVDLLAVQAGAAQPANDRLMWTGFEAREGVPATTPFVEIIVEVGLGQDASLEAIMHEDHVMDDAVAAVWHRVASVASADPEAPLIVVGRAYEYRPGRN